MKLDHRQRSGLAVLDTARARGAAAIRDLGGGDRGENAQIIRHILGGGDGPRRDIVLMNAAAALVVGGKARDLKEGVTLAAHSIDSGAARQKLENLVVLSQKLAHEK